MAASDKPYHNQNLLDVVFGVTSLLMLVSVIMMLVQDYNREYKPEQRVFRDVEAAMAQRLALEALPSSAEMAKADEDVKEARTAREASQKEINEYRAKANAEYPKRDRVNAEYQDIKADLESVMSFYNIEVEKHGPKSAEAGRLLTRIGELDDKLAEKQAQSDAIQAVIAENNTKADVLEAPLTKKLSRQKQVYDRFDSLVKTSLVKTWGFGDTVRSLPILDGFASPTKIQQITNNDIPIDYYFKPVTRFDRCTTCHLGIDRPAYTQENLAKLTQDPKQEEKLGEARSILRARRELLAGLPEQKAVADPDSLKLNTLADSRLTRTRIREFAAHPRLDLFVGANSKHPMEKFGCTTCHSGQGSGTSFTWASHVPNNVADRERWMKENHWHDVHSGDWDYPMLPSRFTESSCLKCHHQVTDLIARDGREEAPTLLKGYNLIREFGCFGCHEISGTKGGKAVGPDLRAEPFIPLDEMTATERQKAESDPDTMPGKLRRVGPSLVRLSEKTNPEWTAKWIRAPRSFRPETKMPHYFGLTNNDPSVLPEDQKKFPDAEIHAITHYLFKLSENQIKEGLKVDSSPAALRKDMDRLSALEAKSPLTDAEKTEVDQINRRRMLRRIKPLENLAKDHKADVGRGQQLFTEKGCLACHSHQATYNMLPSQAEFGPNLSQLQEKLGKKKGDKESARVWLTQWIMNPQFHHPRSRMPVTHLDAGQAADVAEWLLSQPATDLGETEQGVKWNGLTVPASDEDTLKNLAKVYLVRLLPRSELQKFMKGETVDGNLTKDLPQDEKGLFNDLKGDGSKEALLNYVGRKAVSRLGCYGCHEIPGYESAKPIGVGLNDWGKKDASRLAFEDIVSYIKEKYDVVDSLTDKDGKPVVKDKPTYEKFFFDMLEHHGQNRMGYLNQKVYEPRSFDYNRIRAWDDRSRMPQFRFSRIPKNPGEADADYAARKHKTEADARQAVMTFVLGLTAEALPAKAVNNPTGARAAEVRGRQVLDNFNCAGCHIITPGYFEFKPSEMVFDKLGKKAPMPSDHYFPGHRNWTGMPQTSDKIAVHALALKSSSPRRVNKDDETSGLLIRMRTSDALRYKESGQPAKDIYASEIVELPVSDIVYPKLSAETASDPKKMYESLRSNTYGGTFSDLLTLYLNSKDKKAYELDPGYIDSAKGRASAPPSLHGQGERTQSEWLYNFLLNPIPVRKMAVLRMPKFNLSPEDARALVDYFAGVERLSNPGTSAGSILEEIPQQAPAVQEGYFRAKNAEYVARLKAQKAPNGKTLFEMRMQEYQPLFEEVAKEADARKATAKSRLEAYTAKVKDVETTEASAKKKSDETAAAAKKATGEEKKMAEAEAVEALKQYATAKAAADAERRSRDMWERESARLEESAKQNSVDGQKTSWAEKDAYLTDAYRLVTNQCVKCHQVGAFVPKNDILGPPLNLAHNRLRPGWADKWIAHPQRFLPYDSSMPVYFAPDKPEEYGDLFPGSPLDRVTATRDVLMTLPEVLAMPATRQWNLPTPSGEKTGDRGEKTEKK